MENLLDMYGALTSELKFYWVIALIASLVFLVQMILTFVGIGDVDGDIAFSDSVDGDTLDTGGTIQLFSIRNIINFLLGFGWGGVCWSTLTDNSIVIAISAIATGCVFVAVFVLLYKVVMKLECNNAFRIVDSVGATCEVYLRIPAGRSGQGKVQVSIGGVAHELAAMTDGELLPSGSRVRVVDLVDNQTVLVERV